jgi:hypothetical protein
MRPDTQNTGRSAMPGKKCCEVLLATIKLNLTESVWPVN